MFTAKGVLRERLDAPSFGASPNWRRCPLPRGRAPSHWIPPAAPGRLAGAYREGGGEETSEEGMAEIMRTAGLLVFLVLAAGCTRGWTKPGQVQDDYYKDEFDCRKEARTADVGSRPGAGSAFVKSCLRAKGWREK